MLVLKEPIRFKRTLARINLSNLECAVGAERARFSRAVDIFSARATLPETA